MVIPDANILIYAYNADAVQHKTAAEWLIQSFKASELVGLCWPSLWAFIRLNTNPKLWPKPKSSEEVFDIIHDWQSQPNALIVHPGPRHNAILRSLVLETRSIGTLVSDATLAAIAIEHAATLVSTDRDFRRFSGLRWVNPLD